MDLQELTLLVTRRSIRTGWMYRHVRAGFGDRQTDGWLRFRERVVPAKESVHCSCAQQLAAEGCARTPPNGTINTTSAGCSRASMYGHI